MAIHYLQQQIQLLSPFDVHSAEIHPVGVMAGADSVVESDANDTAEYRETPPKPVLTDIPGVSISAELPFASYLRRPLDVIGLALLHT